MSAPAPFIWPQTDHWAGQDGNWSTFPVTVGSQGQAFHILPSTTNSETWIPIPEGCTWVESRLGNCSTTRGIYGDRNVGFQSNASTSWRQIGLYSLTTERDLYGMDENGLYGLDRVVLGTSGSNVSMANQTVAGIATPNFWLGSFGLADLSSSFNVVNGNKPSMMSSLADDNLIPSVSYGYTAGASYRSSPGNLVLGGYDSAAVKLDNISFNIPSGASLLVNLASIVATNTLLGTASMLVSTTGLTMKVDSTVSQLWLPGSVCDTMARAFGLVYDNGTNLYLVNNSMHTRLQEQNPQFTFTLATGPSSSNTTNIALPYAAFDHLIGLPTYNTTYQYFPIRRAANESQYVLGRVFLQEAYAVVDWERRHFTIGQSTHVTGSAKDVVPITSPNQSTTNEGDKHSLGGGAIAGIVIGVVAVIAGIVLALMLVHRRRNGKERQREELAASESNVWNHANVDHKFHEADVDHKFHEADDNAFRPELHGNSVPNEAMSETVHEIGEVKKPLVIHELPGNQESQEVPRTTAVSGQDGRSSPLKKSS